MAFTKTYIYQTRKTLYNNLNLPKFKLRLTAPKNPVPVKENILDLNCWLISPSVEVYIIPALEMNSAMIEVKKWIESKQNKV